MTHSRNRKPAPPASLNLTSMIDVVFLLLVFFLVTTTFNPGEGTMPLPTPGHALPTPHLPLRVTVAASGETGYALDVSAHPTRPVSFGDLQRVLAGLQDNPGAGRSGPFAADNPVAIAPTERARWQHVVNAYNAALKAGYSSITIETVKSPDDPRPVE